MRLTTRSFAPSLGLLLALAGCGADAPWLSGTFALSVPPVLPRAGYAGLLTPGPGQDFTAPATLRLFAIGHDIAADFQSAARVDFLMDGAVVASSSSGQYGNFQATLTNVPAGGHVLAVRSYNTSGTTYDSFPVPITVLAQAAPAGPVFDLAQDIVLSGDQGLDIIGTATARARVNGNGRQIRTSGTWTGRLTIRNADVFGLGQAALPGVDVTASGAGDVTIEGSAFERGGQLLLTINDNASAALRGNTLRANMLVPVNEQPSTSAPVVRILGTSPTQKYFQGNRVGLSWVEFERASNWLVGGNRDEDSNILIGVRAGIHALSSTGMVLRRNYCHQPYHGGWSQGKNIEMYQSPGMLLEHNVIRSGSWPTRGLDGELRYNLLMDNSHAWVAAPASNAYVHHNVLIYTKEQGLYGPEEGVSVIYGAQNVRLHNNTFDGGGAFMTFYGPVVRNVDGALSVRSNVFTGFVRNFPVVLNATGDYNDFYNVEGDPPQNYSGGARGPSDLGAAVNAQVDPRFAQPRPLPYPIDEGAVWNRQTTVADVLALYRSIYTPSLGSPLIDRGDPAGDPGNDIGAVGAGLGSLLDQFGRFAPADAVPPGPVTGLVATAVSSGRVDLSWAAAADDVGVVSYTVERCAGAGCAGFAPIGSAAGTSYSDTGAQAQTTYRYQVRALDAAGNAGATSAAAEATTPAAPAAPPDLVVAYGLDEGSGTATADASGGGSTATLLNGPQWTAGRFGGGLSLDGVNDYVSVPASSATAFGAPLTVSAWIQNQDAGQSWERIVNRKGVWNAADGWEVALADPSAGPGRIAVLGSGGTTAILPCVADWRSSQLNQWVHVAVVIQGSTATLYCNGALMGSAAVNAVVPNSRPIHIGHIDAEPDKHFRGRIDEVRLYRRALTQAQIQSDMNAPIGNPPPPDTVPPGPVTGLAATAVSSGRVDLSWAAATDDVGVVSYTVERCAGAGCAGLAPIGSAAGTSYSDTGAQAQTTYRYQVRALDAAGNAGATSAAAEATTPAAPAAPPDLVVAYGLDEGSGTSAADASGGGSAGTLVSGPQWTAGRFGGALSFDGVNDYVSVPASSATAFGAPLTVSAWIQNQDAGHSWERIVNRKGVWNATDGWEVTLADPSAGPGRIAVLGSGGTTAILPCVADWRSSQLNQWVHVAVVIQGSTATLYCNGALMGSAAVNAVVPNSRPIHIGHIDAEPDKHFRGRIDEVRLYRRALTQAQIQSDMNTPVNP